MKKYKISVIIPVYNHELYIEKAIKSVLHQKDCPSFEIIICNDASTDKCASIIKNYANKYDNIYFINNKKNMGLHKNLKIMFEKAKGDYIAILEGDDYWIDEFKLKKQYEALNKEPDKLVCFTDVLLLNQETGEFSKHEPQIKEKYGDHINIHELIKRGNPSVTFSCCMYNRNILNFIPDNFYEDKSNFVFLFNLYGMDQADAIFIKDPCIAYRIHNKSLWSSKTKRQKYIAMIENAIKYNKLFDKKYEDDFLYFIYSLSKALVNPNLYISSEKTKFSFKNIIKFYRIKKYRTKRCKSKKYVLEVFGHKISINLKI